MSFVSSSRREAPWGKEPSYFSQYREQGLRKCEQNELFLFNKKQQYLFMWVLPAETQISNSRVSPDSVRPHPDPRRESSCSNLQVPSLSVWSQVIAGDLILGQSKHCLSIERTGSTHIHCCKGMKYKAISKYYLLLILVIHNKLENDQKYFSRAFYKLKSKKESSNSKPLRFPPLDIR